MTDWDKRWMGLAEQTRTWVKGPDLGVGAVVVSPDRRRLSLGYSGLPVGIADTVERVTLSALKDIYMVHAELNAIINAGCSLKGWTMYATKCPCSSCALAIVQAGIVRVVSPPPDRASRWAVNQQTGLDIFEEAKIEWKST